MEALNVLQTTTRDKLAKMNKLPAIHKLSVGERAALVKDLSDVLDEVALALANYGPMDAGDSIAPKNDMQEIVEFIDSTKETRDEFIGIMEQLAEYPDPLREYTQKSTSFGDNQKHTKGHRRTKEDQSKWKDSKHYGDWSSKDWFPNHPFGSLKNFDRMFTATGGTDTRGVLHDVNYKSKSGASSLLGRRVSRHSGTGRRRRLAEGGIEDKHHMCIQFAECVQSMSRYDLMVYFKSGTCRITLLLNCANKQPIVV